MFLSRYAARQLWKTLLFVQQLECSTKWTTKEHEKIKVNYLGPPFDEFNSAQHCSLRGFKKGKNTKGNVTNLHTEIYDFAI